MDLFFLLGRILFGGYFLYSGINHFSKVNTMAGYAGSKHVPSPKLAVYFTGVLLFLGGAGVVLGISPAFSLSMLLLFLVPTTFIMHQFWKVTDPAQRMGDMINFMKNVALIGAILMIFSLGHFHSKFQKSFVEKIPVKSGIFSTFLLSVFFG